MLIIGLLFILHKTAGNAKCQTEQRYFVVVAFSLLSEELAFSMMPHVCTNETTAAFAFPMFLFFIFSPIGTSDNTVAASKNLSVNGNCRSSLGSGKYLTPKLPIKPFRRSFLAFTITKNGMEMLSR